MFDFCAEAEICLAIQQIINYEDAWELGSS